MNRNANPFFGFDMTKVMADFDPTKMAEEFSKLAGQYQIPGIDMAAVVESQRLNVEALTQANKAALEGMQAVTKRQTEILQETMEGTQTALEALAQSGSPQDASAKQAELMQAGFGKALGNMKELADLVSKSNAEATQTINQRISETLEEIKTAATDLAKTAK